MNVMRDETLDQLFGNRDDERPRSYELGKVLGLLEYQEDGALCQADAAANHQNQQHGAGSLELFEPICEACIVDNVRVLYARENFYMVFGYR